MIVNLQAYRSNVLNKNINILFSNISLFFSLFKVSHPLFLARPHLTKRLSFTSMVVPITLSPHATQPSTLAIVPLPI